MFSKVFPFNVIITLLIFDFYIFSFSSLDLSEPIFEVDGYEEMTENFDATQEFPIENIEKLEVAQYEQNVNKWTQALVS